MIKFKEGRSPFIFQADASEDAANKRTDPESDEESRISDFSIRASLSRSSSLFEEEKVAALAELQSLADAMSGDEAPASQKLAEETLLYDGAFLDDSQAPEVEMGPDSDVEVVEDKRPMTPSTAHPTSAMQSAYATSPTSMAQLSALLSVVKAKAAQLESGDTKFLVFNSCVSFGMCLINLLSLLSVTMFHSLQRFILPIDGPGRMHYQLPGPQGWIAMLRLQLVAAIKCPLKAP